MGSMAGLDEYGEEKISSLAPPEISFLAPPEFEPRTATPTRLRVFQTMSCVLLPHSIKFSNCKLWVLQIRNLERTWHTVGLPHFVATLLLTVAILFKQPVLATNQNLGSLFPCKAAGSPRSLCTII